MNKSLFELVDELLDLPRLNRESVEKITGLPLVSFNEQDPYFATYHGSSTDTSAEVTEVELRYPGPQSKMKDGFLILSLNPNLGLTIDDARARFGLEQCFSPRPAEAPNTVPNYTSYSPKEARLSFGFLEPTLGTSGTCPGTLVAVIIDRTNC